MTKPKRYKRFGSEFKREAIMRASEEGMTDKAVCDELGVSTRQFRRWRDELALLGKEAFRGLFVSLDFQAFDGAATKPGNLIDQAFRIDKHVGFTRLAFGQL